MSDVTTGKGFDSEFLTHPPRFFGRIVSKESWAGNIASEQFGNVSDLKGWGYRYKVRIFSWHTGDKNTIPDEQLVMANIVMPVTSGSGMGGAVMTPSLEPGSVVTGFFMDGMGGQEPYIDGVLGNSNNNVPKKQGDASPAESKVNPPVPGNVDSLSANSLKKLLNPARTPTKEEFRAASEARQKAKADGLSKDEVERQVLIATVKAKQSSPSPSSKTDQKNIGYSVFNDTYSDSSKFPALVPDNLIVGNIPLSTFDTEHIITKAWNIQDKDRKRKQPLVSACKKKNSEMKGIQRVMKNLINDVEELKKEVGAVNSKVQQISGQVQTFVSGASEEISKYVKTIMGGVRGYILSEVSKRTKKISPLLFPTDIPKFNRLVEDASSSISCVFSKLTRGLKSLIGNLLADILDKVINAALCVIEDFMSKIMDKVLGPIMKAVNAALTPIFALIGGITGAVDGALGALGNVFDALDFISGISKFFKCDEEVSCPDYDEISLGSVVAKPGGDAAKTSLSSSESPTGSGQGDSAGPPSANITKGTSQLQVGESNAETQASAEEERKLNRESLTLF